MSVARPVATVRDVDLPDYQRAARLLLVHGVITSTHPGRSQLSLVRRWGLELGADFERLAGYRVELGAEVVRLVRVLDHLDPRPVGPNTTHRAFDSTRYALLCLALAVLERSGVQVTLTELAKRVRTTASGVAGLHFDPDRIESRRAFCHAMLWLQEVGALRLTDGSLQSWQDLGDAGEALYDIERDVCRAMFRPAVALHALGGTARLLHVEREGVGRDPERRGRRQLLVRLLLERPVLYYDDLDEVTRRHAITEARDLGRDLERLTGARLERRREGLALVDDGGSFSHEPFPRSGTVPQAALLLLASIARRVGEPGVPLALRPGLAATSDRLAAMLDDTLPQGARSDRAPPESGAAPPMEAEQPFVDDAWLLAEGEALCATYGKAFSGALRDEPALLVAQATALLERFDFVRSVPGGVVVLPALARFRDVGLDQAHRQLGLFSELTR